VNIGKLRHRIVIEALSVDIDSDGAQSELWIDWFGTPLWAEIQPLSGRELIAAQSIQSKVSARIIMRYREGIIPSMRVVHRGQYYNIEAVIPDQKSGKEYLTLMTSTGVNDG
jgi:SPP1 family predicted phage head-tail adaptor